MAIGSTVVRGPLLGLSVRMKYYLQNLSHWLGMWQEIVQELIESLCLNSSLIGLSFILFISLG